MRFNHRSRTSLTIVLVMSLAASGCARDSTRALPAGEWTGDLAVPGQRAALGFLAQVQADTPVLGIIALEAMGFRGGPVASVTAGNDSLSFTWTSEDDRRCTLVKDEHGVYSGSCTKEGSSDWKLRLLPPGLRSLPVGYGKTISERQDYAWKVATYDWGRLYAPTSYPSPQARLDSVAQGVAAATRHNERILGTASYNRPIDVFLVNGRDEIRDLMGQPYGSTSDALGSTIILAKYGTSAWVMRHELMHVTSINLWGVPPEPAAWVREGIAVFAAGRCASYDLHDIAAKLADRGELLPLRELLHDFYSHSDLITYLQSGSLFQYLYESRGQKYARDVWQLGLERNLLVHRSDLQTLESEWRGFLASPRVKPDAVDWSKIQQVGCV